MALQFGILAVTPSRQNCTLLWDDETLEAVLTGMSGGVLFALNEVATRRLDVKEIWLTYGHLDHAGGVVGFLLHKDVPIVEPHRDDEFLLGSLPDITTQYGFPVSPPFKLTRWLEEGDVLDVGRYRFDVSYIPGHTPGQVVFYRAQAGLLVTGDVLFYENIGRTSFPRDNHADLIDNIHRKLLVLPDDTQIIAGHGRMTTIGHEKRHNPFLQALQTACRCCFPP